MGAIEEVYRRFLHMDKLFSDKGLLIVEASVWESTTYYLWKAIKEHMAEKDEGEVL